MKNLAVCAALLAISASAMASSETYSVIVAVTQGDLELEPHRSFVSDGEQLHYSRTSTINATQSVTIDEAGKSEETLEPVTLGFDFRATPRLQENGDILLDYSFEDTRLLEMTTTLVGDVEMKLPAISNLSTGSTVLVKEGEPVLLFPGSLKNDSTVTFTLVRN